ncbi:MAG: hypothetical protein H7829_10975 [Magnetococcus sp. THC-1_WYH]
MTTTLSVVFKGCDLNEVAAEVFDALLRFEEMLSIVEHCGEVAINPTSTLRTLLKLQGAVLENYKELTVSEMRSRKMQEMFDAILPIPGGANTREMQRQKSEERLEAILSSHQEISATAS